MPQLAERVAHPNGRKVVWGIRLPRNEFRGKRTNPDQIGFGKRPMQETVPTAESYPIKMSQKDIAMKMERFIMEAIIKTIAFSLFRYIEPALLP